MGKGRRTWKTEGAVKNGHWQHWAHKTQTEHNKKTQHRKQKKYEQHRPHEKTGGEEKQLLSVLLVANGWQNEIMKKQI
jgi:uncharacterized protein YecA (UPF0149 family)